MSDVGKLLEELRSRPETEGLLRECADSDYAEALLSVAGRLGIDADADAEEVRAFLREAEESRRASTDRVIEEVAELDDDGLEAVAGGRANCSDNRLDDFWACGINDKCSKTWNCRGFMF